MEKNTINLCFLCVLLFNNSASSPGWLDACHLNVDLNERQSIVKLSILGCLKNQRGAVLASWCSVTAACLLLISIGCGQAKMPLDGPTAVAEHDLQGEDAHWGYSGEEGPDRWADLDPDFALCREGTEQSPIDLSGATAVDGENLERSIGSTVLSVEQRTQVMDLVDNGHTIQVTSDLPMAIDLDAKHYELVQFHFHSPSEHTIDGEHSPLEVHFVHKTPQGELAVIGLLVEEGAHDVLWEPVIEGMPDSVGDDRRIEDLKLDMSELRPIPTRYFRYRGSLTTPPCSEDVEWVVMVEKQQISSQQMAAVVSHLHHNNRPVQPLGERQLLMVSKE